MGKVKIVVKKGGTLYLPNGTVFNVLKKPSHQHLATVDANDSRKYWLEISGLRLYVLEADVRKV